MGSLVGGRHREAREVVSETPCPTNIVITHRLNTHQSTPVVPRIQSRQYAFQGGDFHARPLHRYTRVRRSCDLPAALAGIPDSGHGYFSVRAKSLFDTCLPRVVWFSLDVERWQHRPADRFWQRSHDATRTFHVQ